MKKKLFFLAVAAVTLASCSNDETIASQANSQANEISFRPLTGGITRATTTTGDSFTSGGFYVEAHKTTTTDVYFTATHFTKQDGYYRGDGAPYYWPDPTSIASLTFYAYYPNPDGTYIKKDAYNTFTVSPNQTKDADHKDLVYGCTTEATKASSGSGISLNFKHAASLIDLIIYNSKTNLKIYVDEWKIGNLFPAGIFTYPANTSSSGNTQMPNSYWSLYDAEGSDAQKALGQKALTVEYKSTISGYETNQTTNYIPSSSSTPSGISFILVPQTLSAINTNYDANGKLQCSFIAVKMKIVNASTGDVIANGTVDHKWAIWPIGGYAWEPGKHYTYKIDLGLGGYYETNTTEATGALIPLLEGAEIMFAEPTITPWTDVARTVENGTDTTP